mmetsp:Transcript_21334/g.52221  ORF Transcript_21334/g.52221 Transcript_21334/m.52221 type:complete len:104 (-) Transcript_21334:230-541(-)
MISKLCWSPVENGRLNPFNRVGGKSVARKQNSLQNPQHQRDVQNRGNSNLAMAVWKEWLFRLLLRCVMIKQIRSQRLPRNVRRKSCGGNPTKLDDPKIESEFQ